MKKILFICDGVNFPKGAFHFIKLMNENEPLFAKGIFFTPIDFDQMIPVSYVPIAQPYVKFKEEEKKLVRVSQDQFVRQCENYGIKYRIRDKADAWDKELFVKESRFADLVVISEELFCSTIFIEQPNFFMQEALRGAECPVVVVPENFKSIDRLAVAYDGGKESVFALKQFSYLLSQFAELPSEFVYIKNEESDDIPDRDLLREYTSLHFNSLATSKLHFDPKKYLTTWLEEKKNVLLVTGSFARSSVSNLLNRSFASSVIQDHTSPVFIAHHP